MNEHRYILEPYKGMNTRYQCPACQHRDKTFSMYIDTLTGKHIATNVGRCNRENNCGYHYTPKQYFQDNNIYLDTILPSQNSLLKPKITEPQAKPFSFIPFDIFKTSLQKYNENNFIDFLSRLFSFEIANELISKYYIGTSDYWNGSTVFWQIDIQGKIRTGKIMLYNAGTGKRIKKPYAHINWVHKTINQTSFELKQCFFGEHLLIDKTKPVALVESEKTAIIASVYLPQYIWMAVGSLSNLNAEKCQVLKGRTVVLFPDLNGFEKWSHKAKELSQITRFTVSDLLERKASEAEKKQGLDLADYLIQFDYKEFQSQTKQVTKQAIKKNTDNTATTALEIISTSKAIKENWQQDITELESYFNGIELPKQAIKPNRHSIITNIKGFIESHFTTVKANIGKRAFLPYLTRLQELKQYLLSFKSQKI